MEILDVVTKDGVPTGETVERAYAHRNGIMHRTSHVWIYARENGKTYLLLQKRCLSKDSYPGCYDISSAGHIPAGVDFVPSALRELEEELGIVAEEEELLFCGLRYVEADAKFHGIPYHDRQVSGVYALERPKSTEFRLQKEEIESVLWMEFNEVCEKVRRRAIPTCIDYEELEMLRGQLLH